MDDKKEDDKIEIELKDFCLKNGIRLEINAKKYSKLKESGKLKEILDVLPKFIESCRKEAVLSINEKKIGKVISFLTKSKRKNLLPAIKKFQEGTNAILKATVEQIPQLKLEEDKTLSSNEPKGEIPHTIPPESQKTQEMIEDKQKVELVPPYKIEGVELVPYPKEEKSQFSKELIEKQDSKFFNEEKIRDFQKEKLKELGINEEIIKKSGLDPKLIEETIKDLNKPLPKVEPILTHLKEVEHIETTPEEASYYSLKSDLESGFAKMVNSFRNKKGFYPEKLTNEILKNLSPIPTFQKNPKLYLRWAEEQNKKLKEENEENKNKPEIILPTAGKLDSFFAEEIGEILKDKYVLYYRQSSRDIIEIIKIKEKGRTEEYLGFSTIRPERFITLIEKYIIPSIEVKTSRGIWLVSKSMNQNIANILLASSMLQDFLPKIKRIFPSPIPIIYENKLTFPKKGYDERFYSYMPLDSPEIKTDISLEEAKNILNKIYEEFCFQDKQDKINAIAGLLTPFLRGLFPTFSTRTPILIYIGNRERVGKEYCADITGLVYEGYALQEPPISNGEKAGNNNEELRKKILSAFIGGRKRLHFANNKGYIDNAVFEMILTNEKYSDRALGRNEILTFDNEIDFSLSGNVGIRFTPDLINRGIFVRLFLDIEDANERKFENPNLHIWVKNNRGLILSALYTLVRNWFEKGCPNGNVFFASYPEWARICGGIMESAGYESPCVRNKENLSMGGDVETNDMKTLFELCYEKFPNEWITKQQIRNLIILNEEGVFGYLDFDKKSDQTNFGLKMTKFIGRILSDIILKVKSKETRASRQEFMFTKDF